MHALLIVLLLSVAAGHRPDLTGTVTDPSGKALPNAHVFVYTAYPKIGASALCPSCYKDCGKHEHAGASGQFRIGELDPSLVFNILAVAPGYQPAFARTIDPARGPVSIKLSPRSDGDAVRLIRGVVVDPDGKAVIGAVVEPNGYIVEKRAADGRLLKKSTGYGDIPGVDKLSVTDENGEFALRIPDADAKLDVRVHARNFAPRIARELIPGHPGRIQLAVGVTITGHLVRDGKPVEGARVGFVQVDRNSRNFLGTEEIGTNDQGLFVMTALGPDEEYAVYPIMRSFGDGAAPSRMITVGGNGSAADAGTIVVEPGRRISGCVAVPADFRIPPHTTVMLNRDLAWDTQLADIREDGSFEFTAVPSEPVSLSVHIPGLHLASPPEGLRRPARSVDVPASGNQTGMTIVLER
jgi:hypothetical protein